MSSGRKVVKNLLRLFDRAERGAVQGPIYSVVLQGGLGNRLFQLGSIYGVSRLHGARFVVAPEYVFGNSHSSQSYERYYREFLAEKTYHFEKYCEDPFRALSYDEISKQESNTLFEGFFQSEKYFWHVRRDILRLFGPTPSERQTITSLHGRLEKTAFIHVRMGDFIGDSLHEIDLSDYYQYCLKDIHQRFGAACILVSTDDRERCLERLPFLAPYDFLEEQNEILALYTLASCGLGGVCANSSFSWWGAWLNTSRRKRVYLPSKWLSDSRIGQKDIAMKKSIVVELGQSVGNQSVRNRCAGSQHTGEEQSKAEANGRSAG